LGRDGARLPRFDRLTAPGIGVADPDFACGNGLDHLMHVGLVRAGRGTRSRATFEPVSPGMIHTLQSMVRTKTRVARCGVSMPVRSQILPIPGLWGGAGPSRREHEFPGQVTFWVDFK